jgi:type III restriction enzyme
MPTGLLLFCVEYRSKGKQLGAGVFDVVDREFESIRATGLGEAVRRVYNFRNTYIAHEKGEELISQQMAEEALHQWIGLLVSLEDLVMTYGGG